MDASGATVELPGSERGTVAGTRRVAAADPAEPIVVTVLLRRRAAPGVPAIRDYLAPRIRSPGRFVPREEFARAYGSAEEDVESVRSFARAAGLVVAREDPARRTVRLAGSTGAFAAAFGVALDRYEGSTGTFRGRVGPLRVPADLRDRVVAVLGLDGRPQARPHYRICPSNVPGAVAYSPVQVGAAYSFPSGADGSGETIGLIELGGGYRSADLTQFFEGIGVPAPSVTSVEVDGATNAPTGDPSGPDAEVALDIEVAGALAPGATVVVYFAPNTDQGFLDALSTAVHDATHRPSVVSVSWGSAEGSWTAQARNGFETVFEDAAALGVTVLASSGDSGADDAGATAGPTVDFPASSPEVVGCGGTRLLLAGGAIAQEVVWNDLASGDGATGGGVSVDFARPSYQSDADVPAAPNGFVGRGVPDVAGDADPTTGYRIRVDGTSPVLGGTSAVAPLWAALIARINQILGSPVGFVTPRLYAAAGGGAFRDITSGGNGVYTAGPGWDPCTGLGSPEGTALATVLRGG